MSNQLNSKTPKTAQPNPARVYRWGGVCTAPLRFLRWTGYLKYRPISHKRFNTTPFITPKIFEGKPPHSVTTDKPWIVSQPINEVMGHLVILENGIADCFGDVFDKNGRLIEGATHKYSEKHRYRRWHKRKHLIQQKSIFPDLEYFDKAVAILTASTHNFYFHWLLDVLPRIGMLSELSQSVDLFYIQTKHQFQQETLRLLGIDRSSIVDADEVPLMSAQKLVVPCYQVMNGRVFADWPLKYVRDKLLKKAKTSSSVSKRRIIVSRASASHRRLTNEAQIVDKLSKYNFEVVELAAIPFQEQIGLFKDAEAIVAPHGSGLANLVFCTPGTKIIELFPATNVDLYYRLSSALSLEYSYVKSRTGDPHRLSLDNYCIEWQDLERTLYQANIQ